MLVFSKIVIKKIMIIPPMFVGRILFVRHNNPVWQKKTHVIFHVLQLRRLRIGEYGTAS